MEKIYSRPTYECKKGHEIYLIKNDNYQIHQQYISAGMLEILNIITHLIAFEEHVFVIEEPESHLHVHAERLLGDLIKESSNNNQIICTTHSTSFINTEDLDGVTIVRAIKGASYLQ